MQSEVAVQYVDAPLEELVDALEQISALECAVHASLVELVCSLSLRDDWQGDASCLEDLLRMHLGISRSVARDLCLVASRASSLPLCFAAFRSGTLTWERLVILCSFATSSQDLAFSETARNASVSQLRRMARQAADASDDEAVDIHTSRYLRIGVSHDERSCWLRGRLSIDDGLQLRRVLETVADSAGPDETGAYDSHDHRMADALVELSCRDLRSVGDPDLATLVIETTAQDLLSGSSADLEGVARIPPSVTARLGCDARIQSVEMDNSGHVVGIGRVSRVIPPWLRRKLKRRDQGCRFPGCSRTNWIHGHHIKHWADGGPTNMGNLIELCGHHHRFVHEAKWHIEGNPNENVVFITPVGKRYSGAGPPLRDEVAARFPLLRTAKFEPVVSTADLVNDR